MRIYEIFLVDKDIVQWYIHKEDKLFQLFLESRKFQSKKISLLLQQQINFITTPLSMETLDHSINQHLSYLKDYRYHKYQHAITLKKGKSFASLNVLPRKVVIKSIGLSDAELVFFEILRQLEDTFIAVDYSHRHIGFLKPIKRALIK